MNFSPGAVRALPKTCAALGAALLAMGAGAGQAQAAGSTLVGNGLHISTGALVDPNGRTWVADHNAGFCRVAKSTDDGPGVIEHPQRPDEGGPQTCLGGLLPDAQPGPDAAGAPTFLDPSPEFAGSGDELAFIPDGASPSSEVVRARWNPHTGLFEYQDTVTMQGARGRPVSASLGPDESVYVSFQRETTIQRITDAASDTPAAEVIGRTSDARGAAAVAAGRDAEGRLAVYVAESVAGLRVLRPALGTRPVTEAVSGFDVPAATISALSYDLERDLLWAGTADSATTNEPRQDELIRVDVREGAVDAEHATGYTMVGGVAAKADGKVLVVDDPALIDPAEPLGTGRLFHVGLPAAHVAKGPIDDLGEAEKEVADRTNTRDDTPAFDVTGDGTLQCLLRGPGHTGGWEDCPADGRYSVASALADGRYTLSVRSRVGDVTGLPEAHAFTVDTKIPLPPKVVRPGDQTTVSGSPWFEFESEVAAAFSCVFDGGPAEPCRPGRTRTYHEAGTHTLQLAQIDLAGNSSELSPVTTYTVDPTLPPATPPGWGPGPPSHRGSSLFTRGLHISAGALVDPNGRTWVADHNGGFCRVTEPGEYGAGNIEHPQIPGDLGPRTCLGGLLPDAGVGPDAAGQPALFDPTPVAPGSGDELALIPDGASPSSEVVRARWNPDSGLFEYVDTISTIGDRTRPVGVSIIGGAAYVVFQRSGDIQRISNLAGDTPVVRVVGFTANGRRASAVAAGRDSEGRISVYVAEDDGIRSVEPNAVTPQVARPAFALPGAAPAVSALIYDDARDHLYAGTGNGVTQADAGGDSVHRINTTDGSREEYSTGYSMIGGFGLRPDGVLFVMDDPALLDPAEPLATGRMFHIGLPAAHIEKGPLTDDGTEAADRGHIADSTPTFQVRGEEAVMCRLTGEGLPGEWQDCPADGIHTPAESLADGSYTLAVRSMVKGVAAKPAVEAADGVEAQPAVEGVDEIKGLVEVHEFAVDTTAPGKPSITSPTGGTVGAAPWFEFASEADASFVCRWDGAVEYQECSPGRTRTFTETGSHTLQIKAIDRAGNVSEESDALSFQARGQVTQVTIDSGPEGPTRDSSPTFAFSADSEDVEFGCRISGQAFAACNGTKSYTALAEGTYHFEVRAKDSAGNITPVVRRTFTVDRRGPVMTVSQPAEGAITGGEVTVAMRASEAATWTCRLDGQAFESCGTSRTFTRLTDGEHVLEVVGTDQAGNQGEVLTRRFTVRNGFLPAPPAPPAAVEPTVTVIDEASRQPLTIRIVDIDRRVSLERIREQGIRVTVRPAQGTRLIRFRVFRVDGNGRRARAAGSVKPVVTIYRRAGRGQTTVRLTRKELRRIRVGSYQLEVAGGRDRRKMGKSVTRAFRVTR